MSNAKFELFEGKRFMPYLEQENLCFALYETAYLYGDSCNTNSCKTPIKESDEIMNLFDLVKERIKPKPFIGDCFVPDQTCYCEWQVMQYCNDWLCCSINHWNDTVGNLCNS